MSTFTKNFILVFLVLFAIAAAISYGQSKRETPEVLGISTLVQHIQKDNVASLTVKGSLIEADLKDTEKKHEVRKEQTQSLTDLLGPFNIAPEKLTTIDIKVESERGAGYWFGVLLPFLAPLIILGLLLYFMGRQVSGMNNRALGFGQSGGHEQKPEDKKDKVTFADVAGSEEAKKELEEIIDFLKDPKRFTKMGAKIPKGVLMMGSPGTGKTLLAKAVAGEADVPFFHMSGSEFVEMFVGVGASRVRSLFQRAKKTAPAIVFIDEIDAVGRRRGAGLGGSHDEREQTLNQILVEMDGFDPNIGVIVIAATNRPDVLDPALLRPGRFDRRVVLDQPDIQEREAILKIHAKNKPLAKDVSLRKVAERTPGFSGADLANLLNEAAILAVRRDKKEIQEIEILESVEKVLLGPERKSRVISPKEKEMTAYHEAGHALVAHFLPDADPVRKISIISRGRAGGYTLKMPEEDKRYHYRAEFIADLAVALGGYATEKMMYGFDAISTGPSSDLEQATKLARAMVTRYGMSKKLGPRTYGEQEDLIFLGRDIHEQRDYSEKWAEMIDKEVGDLIEEGMAIAEKILKVKRSLLDKLVKTLIEKETLEQEEFVALVGARQQGTKTKVAPEETEQKLVPKKEEPKKTDDEWDF
ncbi:MAG: ATP-dependent zinc metalloprotease FtsH [Candidatus Magasanikbacteria bacterium GW2011_GWA2_46_17]|uniref:ATP-dependent zinc metalloprotease FtsH n=1 Tax=Candidatus Magasanikbacteria bacterium GW2011_GWA2_46_17 TaxID=1619042 RepID=A0A0G1RB61_9BACT|nr:MAG: ATP-dependent zinc metalloprotease FtsH [Candidatus Magasanikbacteria bacterium GW2011_GWA2_46_17]HBF67178.1 cell division protein FtsH [Candidatus Magasanikbacteria bacterium]